MSLHLDKAACPFCTFTESTVKDSRGTWRRRECLDCGERFSTEERVRPIWLTRDPKHKIPHVRRQPALPL